VKYVNRVNFSATPIAVVMNKGAWESLTPEQKSIVSAAAQTAAVNTGKAYDGADEEGLAKLAAKGAKVVNFSAADVAKLKELALPEWKTWEESLQKEGVNAQAFMAAFKKAIASQQ
jgi:TRAP-type C4-dicarboxylate transport system substrate-binding protein